MVTLRVVRDKTEQVLAVCQSPCLPVRGELLQLDNVNANGEPCGSSTLWKVVWVTMHVPSLRSDPPADGTPLAVRTVEVGVIPDVAILPAFADAAAEILSEPRM